MDKTTNGRVKCDLVIDRLTMDHPQELREQDKWLPIANVYRIMKNALPANAKVSKEAKECVQECVSEFVSFITSEASEKCWAEKRKTVNGEDVLFAMTSLGFENYAEVLKIYLTKYREYLAAKERSKKMQQHQQLDTQTSTSPEEEKRQSRFGYGFDEGQELYDDYRGQFMNMQ